MIHLYELTYNNNININNDFDKTIVKQEIVNIQNTSNSLSETLIEKYSELDELRQKINDNNLSIVLTPNRNFNITSLIDRDQTNPFDNLGVVNISKHYDMSTPSTTISGCVFDMYNVCLINDNNNYNYDIKRTISNSLYHMIRTEITTDEEDRLFNKLKTITNPNMSVNDFRFVGCHSDGYMAKINDAIIENAFGLVNYRNIDNDEIDEIVGYMQNYQNVAINLSLTTDIDQEQILTLVNRLNSECNVKLIEISDISNNKEFITTIVNMVVDSEIDIS